MCSESVPNCLLCTYSSGQVYCEKCSTGTGFDCGTSECTTSDCNEPWVISLNPQQCYCKSCATFTAASVNRLGSLFSGCLPSQTLPQNCLMLSNEFPPVGCIQCTTGYIASGGVCHSTSGWNCKPGYIIYTDKLICEIPSPHFCNLDPTVQPQPVQTPITGCLFYKTIQSPFLPSLARCIQCEAGKIVEFTSASFYTCKQCTLDLTTVNCLYATSYNGECYCGKCIVNANGISYVMKPDMSGCLACNIPLCSEHTSQLISGNYVCRCKVCINSLHTLNEDGSGCVDCSSVTCISGTKYVENNVCKCKCQIGYFMSSDKSTCISCSSSDIANCRTEKYYLENNVCKCSQCIDGYVLSANSKTCLSCQTSPGAGVPNCRLCTSDKTILTETSACLACFNRYGIYVFGNSNKGSCVQCEAGCKVCSVSENGSTKNLCKECLLGYSLNNQNACIQCPQTPSPCNECITDEFDNSKTRCKQFSCSGNTALRDSDFKCEICSITNCQHCLKDINSKWICLKCQNSFFLDSSGLCKSCVSDCDFCLDANRCLQDGCKESFVRHRLTGKCTKCPGDGVSRCEYQSLTNALLIPKICQKGYVLNNAVSPSICDS